MSQFRAPTERSAQVYQQVYAAVLNNPYWYSDRPRLLGETFSAENTRKRTDIVIDILRRVAKRKPERQLSQRYLNLANKLFNCRRDRCGSSACLECLRAFQQAKTIAHRRLIFQLAIKHPEWLWCIITIIPLELNYPRGTLREFDAAEFNRHLKDTLTWGGITRRFVGSIDFSLEESSVGKYWQPHWLSPFIPVIRKCCAKRSRICFRLWRNTITQWMSPKPLTLISYRTFIRSLRSKSYCAMAEPICPNCF
jgi:hypothetical protein